MSNPKDETFHENQIERFMAQILRAFSGFTVKDGVVRGGQVHEEKVPVIFGSPSRVVAAILSNDSKFRNVKVPLMAVNLSGIEIDDTFRLNRFHENELTFAKTSSGDVRNVKRLTGAPYRLSIDLGIYASSMSQLLEIFEKIALTFNPEVVIQKSTDAFDSDYISTIRLEGVSTEITQPLGQSHRTTQMNLQFSSSIRLSYPPQDKDPLEGVVLRVKDEDSSIVNSEDIIDITSSEEIE